MPRATTQSRQTNEATASERLNLSTLRPGYLVSLRTSVRGNVSYDKVVIEANHKTRTGAQKEKWQTERTIADPEEHTKANQARMKARATVAAVCAISEFGLLCPESKIPELVEAIKEARRVVDVFNRRSRLTTVSVYVISGKIARDDVEAARAINSEVRELLKNMAEGIKNVDVKAVREAANKARNLGSMLTPEASEKIKGAIEKARGAARKIVKAGEEAAQEIDREAIKAITSARTAFLDLDDGPSEPVTELPATDAREVDLTPGEAANDDRVVAGARTGRVTRRRATAEV